MNDQVTVENESSNSKKAPDKFFSYEEIPLILGANELMALLGFSRTNVYCMLNAEDFPAIVIGKRRLVRKDKLFEWIEAHEQKPKVNNKPSLKSFRTA